MRLGAQTPRLQRVPGGVASSAAEEAILLAESCGLYLDPWQKWCVEQILGEDINGAWVAWTVLLILPRQNGKNAILEVIELAALYLFGEKRIIHTAHLQKTAMDHMQRMKALVHANPQLEAITKFYDANGKERMVRTDTGAQIEFVTRGQKTLRGGSPSRVIFDEALYLTDVQAQAIVPSLAAQSMNAEGAPQIIYTSSAPLKDSDLLHRVRNAAFFPKRKKPDPNTQYDRTFAAEWGIELPKGGFAELDLDDVDLWAAANPGFNIRISEEWIRVQERDSGSMTDEAFAIERLGVVFPQERIEREAKIPADAWSSTISLGGPPLAPGLVTIGFGVSIDGLWSAIAIAAGTISKPYVELIRHAEGVGWLPDELARLANKWKPKKVGCLASGPTGAQVAAVLEAFQKADPPIPIDMLQLLNMTEFAAGCGGLFTDIVEGRLERPAVTQEHLDLAVAAASERKVGDGFAWDARHTDVPICALDAITVGRQLLPTEVLVPVKAGYYGGEDLDDDDDFDDDEGW